MISDDDDVGLVDADSFEVKRRKRPLSNCSVEGWLWDNQPQNSMSWRDMRNNRSCLADAAVVDSVVADDVVAVDVDVAAVVVAL